MLSSAPVLDNPFWHFSLDRYARVGVAPACLRFQNEFGIDVNVLLFAFWLGKAGRRVVQTDARAELGLIAEWNDLVVKPLRSFRAQRNATTTALNELVDPIGEEIKRVTLRCEQIEQAFLFELADEIATLQSADERENMVQNAKRLLPALCGENDRLVALAWVCV